MSPPSQAATSLAARFGPGEWRIDSILRIFTCLPKRRPRRCCRRGWYRRPDECSPPPVVLPYKGASPLTPASTYGRSPTRPYLGAFIAGVRPGTRWAHPVNPCGNFSGTSSLKFRGTKGSIGHTFMVCIHTENQNQGDFYPFVLLEISVLHESPLGHLRYGLTDVPPQPNSPPDNVFNPDRPARDLNARSWAVKPSSASLNK